MSIHKINAGPWGCADLTALAIFLGAGDDTNTGGRNRYHCSYIIYTDGIYFYAENGTTGELDYGGPSNEPGGTVSGTDADAVIQAAIAATTSGGKIHLKEGTYDNLDQITIGQTIDDIVFTGSGWGTILKARNGLNDHLFIIYGTNVVFENLCLDGNAANQTAGDALRIGAPSIRNENVTVHNVYIKDPYSYGLTCYGHKNHIINNTVEMGTATVTGMIFNSSNENRIIKNYVESSITFTAAPERNIVEENIVYDVQPTKTGIYFADGSYNIATGNIVYNTSGTTDTTVVGFRAEVGGSYNSFIANIVYNTGVGLAIDGDNTYGLIKGNHVYNTAVGIRCDDSGAGTVYYITIEGNIVNGNNVAGSYGIWLKGTEKVLVKNNQFYNTVNANVRVTTSNVDVRIEDNIFSTYVETGTITNIIVMNNEGYNPIDVVVNPFDTPNQVIEMSGAAATPIANTDYTVRTADIVISSTDSGNTDCAIMLKDGSGTNVLQAALSTIDHMYVPIGFQINWGAFTGAAPTVTVAFR